MNTGKRGFILFITLLLVTTWIGCSSDEQLTSPTGSAQVSLNISFAPSIAKQNIVQSGGNSVQVIDEVTVSVLDAGSNVVVIKEQRLEIVSTPQGRFAEGELSIPVQDDSQPFVIIVFASDLQNLGFFVGVGNVTLEAGEIREEPVDIFIEPAISIGSSGTVTASSTFPEQGFGATSGIDLKFNTSWFSDGANADGNTSTFTWTAPQTVFLGTAGIFNNLLHSNPSYRSGFGFQTVTFQVYDGPDASGSMVYEETVDYPRTFPVVRVSPFVAGRSIKLLLNDHEDPTCGGFSELLVVALDLSTGEPLKTLLAINLSPLNPTITVGQTTQFQATGTYSDFSTENITNDVTWGSSNQNVASITTAGLAEGFAQGSTLITATQGGISGQTNLTVNPAQLSGATLTDLQVPLVQLNDATNCTLPDQRIASLFDIIFSYTDPDGDVTTGTTALISFTFSPSNTSGSFQATNPALTGNGFQGTISTAGCFVFGTDTSVRVTVSITDAGNKVSNATSVAVQKPEGANLPPDGTTIGQEFLPQVGACTNPENK